MLRLLAVAYVLLFLTAAASIGLVIYNSWGVLRNVKPKNDHLANIAAPFILFLPALLTETGNRHRKKAIRYGLIFVLSIAGMWSIKIIGGE